MDSSPQRIALLVYSCDRYEFLFKGFEYFFSKHWDFHIPCTYYFATEEKPAVISGFQNIKSGKGEWSDRLSLLLKTQVREDYVLFFQEDMWLNKDVNKKFFTMLFDWTLSNKCTQVKLHSSGVYKTTATPAFIEGFNISKVDNTNSNYLMSHQVTLWDKNTFINQLHKNEHPWRNERRGTKRLRKVNPEIFQIDYFAENGNAEINNNQNPVGRSEYQSISVNGILNHNVQSFINTLNEGNDEQKHYSQQLLHHYQNNLTHDGKPKPRKEDIFQKTKKNLGLRK